MTKKQAIHIISRCAKLYRQNLENHQIAFVYRDAENSPAYTEVQFRSYHFLHFTGISPRTGISANDFYRYALNNKISEQDFQFKDSYTTESKLQILDVIMYIDTRARMIGNYSGPSHKLYTEKVTGTTSACLGLIQKDQFFLPNSVLKTDIRLVISKPPGKIYVILKKKISDSYYNCLTYQSKNLHLIPQYFPENLLHQIDSSLLGKR